MITLIFSAATDSSDNLNFTIPHIVNQAVQIIISLNHNIASNFCRIWHKFIIRKFGENIHRRLHYRLLMRISDEKARNFTSRIRKICLERPAAGTANQHNVRSTAVGPVRINSLRYRKSRIFWESVSQPPMR